MPFRERSAWISLIVTPVVWGLYFWELWPDLRDGSLEPGAVGLFVSTVIILLIVQIVLAIVLAIVSGKAADAPMDERERLIDLKAARIGYYLLGGLLFLVSALWMTGASPLVMANGILAAMVLAETLRAGRIVAGYRWSF